jgi:hypothetical protein
MDTASIELCKELFTLSKWELQDCAVYALSGESKIFRFVRSPSPNVISMDYYIPAYDLGYLLRKLPQNLWVGYVDTSGKRGYALANTYAWNAKGDDIDKIAECRADTPEDAACKLAIELFQQGILKRE